MALQFGVDPDVMMSKPISRLVWFQDRTYRVMELKAMRQRDEERRRGTRR